MTGLAALFVEPVLTAVVAGLLVAYTPKVAHARQAEAAP